MLWVLSTALWLQTIRRLHDLGRTGWWVAAIMLAEVALMAFRGTYPDAAWADWLTGLLPATCLMLIAILPGESKENRFGARRTHSGRTKAAA